MKFEAVLQCESCQHSAVCKHFEHYIALYEEVKKMASDDVYGDLFTLLPPKCSYHAPKTIPPRDCGEYLTCGA